ncbi:MAG: exonuclease SbcCD subunit D [Chloroflexaceae bacterium]|nr:exonuclease SbcCD subunit D [Chloroflexaceae bacterium]
MIKILHLADLHIGVENYGRIEPTTGLHSRLIDYLERLDEAISLGLAHAVDLVLIAGDIYKSRNPNPTHQREFAQRMKQLRDAGVPVFMITGNHDIAPTFGRAHSIEIFGALQVAGITIADRPRMHQLETRAGPLQIIAVPWVTRNHLLTHEDMAKASFGEIDTLLRQRIDAFIDQEVAGLSSTIPTVLAMHATIDGAQLGAERSITLGQDLVFSRGSVACAGIDYVALGHIHRHQSLGEHPPIVYPGSIERIDFGEEHEDKGCVLVELERGNTRWTFHRLNARPMVSINVDVRQSGDPAARVAQAIVRQQLQQAIVRVDIHALEVQKLHLSVATIRAQLEQAGAFCIAAIAINVERDSRNRFPGIEPERIRGMTMTDALELYLQQKHVDPERRAALLARATRLLEER